jgi:putative hydrolase of the HAD superfamily
MKHYRHLFFDLDNTVWDFNMNSRFALLETFKLYNLDQSLFEGFLKSYIIHNEKLWALYRQNGITKEELTKKRFDLSFQETGLEGVDAVAFNRDYLDNLPFQTRLCDGALEVLEKLSRKYEMHIITNGFREVQYKKMEKSDLNRFFKRIFVSEEIKSPKPSPEIFRHAMKSCNARKKESLMIGDDWEVDILGAMQTGIDQVHYAPNLPDIYFTDEELVIINRFRTATFRINRLEELLDML